MKLPGLTVAPSTRNDEFQAVADAFNEDLRAFVAGKLEALLKSGELPADGSGAAPTIVAVIAAMLHAAGYLTASFEPSLNGDILAAVVGDQFDAGRRDFHFYNSGSVQ